MSIIIDKYIVSLLKLVCSCYVWMVLSFIVIIPSEYVQAQDPDEEGEIFWGDEEEELDEDEFEEEEYLDDEDYYDEEEDAEEQEDDEEDPIDRAGLSLRPPSRSFVESSTTTRPSRACRRMEAGVRGFGHIGTS